MATSISSQKLDCKDLQSYLRTLSSNILDRLYNSPATCLAVFRELPELSKHYVMRLLFVDQPVSQAVIGLWVNNKHHNEHRLAVRALSDLRIWYERPLPGGLQGWMLNATFKSNMKTALLGGGTAWVGRGNGSLGPDKNNKDIEFLDKYAIERWECVLHFMVGSTEGADGVSRDINDVLLHSELMKKGDASEPMPFITPSGFQFLLMDTTSQIWYFMLQYLDTVESKGLDVVECLSFLFQLSFSTLGKDYSTEGMTEGQQRFLQHLREFGLVYQRKRKEKRYYPTRLAINLASGLTNVNTDTHKQGYIMVEIKLNFQRKDKRYYPTRLAINLASGVTNVNTDTHKQGYIMVETNYRVYAYTDSPLNIALLALFSEMLYRFPNMTVANLSRDSVREALMRGITAEQIINFLRSHAHPDMLKHNPVLPPTIVDQVRLWELERDRFKFNDGVLYSQFLSHADFEKLRDYAKDIGVLVWDNAAKPVMVVSRAGHDPDIGVLVWDNAAKRVMVVSRAGHDPVRKFWKQQKQANNT